MDLRVWEILRNIVSDADKLEALGEVAVQRMIMYENLLEPKKDSETEAEFIRRHYEHICKHCDEKLYRLISDGFIITEHAKSI